MRIQAGGSDTSGLSTEDRKRIYEEEKARNEAQQKLQQKQVAQGCLGCLGLIVVIVIISAVTGLFTSEETEESRAEVGSHARYVTEAGTLERTVEHLAIRELGKTANWSGNPPTIIAVEKTSQYDGGYLIAIRYRADDNLTSGLIRSGIIVDARDLNKALFKDPRCGEVKECMLMPHFKLVDQYGSEKVDQVGKLLLSRTTAEKINWENMYTAGFEQLLKSEGQLWLHPALRE